MTTDVKHSTFAKGQDLWRNYSVRDEELLQSGMSNTAWYHRQAYVLPVRKILDQHIHTGDRVLDIGCGIGKWVEYLLGRGVDCVGIDSSNTAVAAAQQRLQQLTDRQVVFKGDATDLPFERKSFDQIISFGLLEHFPNHEQVLRHWCEFLKEDGKLFLSVPNGWRWDWLLFEVFFKLYKRRGLLKLQIRRNGLVCNNFGYEERWLPHYFQSLCRQVGFTMIDFTTLCNLSMLLFYVFGDRIPFELFRRLANIAPSPRAGIYLFGVAQKSHPPMKR